MMKKFSLIILLMFVPLLFIKDCHSVNREYINYTSIGGMILGIDLENGNYHIGDGNGQLKKCEESTVKDCIIIGNTIIAIPDVSKLRPLRASFSMLNDIYGIAVQPNLFQLRMLGVDVEVIKIHIFKKGISESSIMVYYNEQYGIVAFKSSQYAFVIQNEYGIFRQAD